MSTENPMFLHPQSEPLASTNAASSTKRTGALFIILPFVILVLTGMAWTLVSYTATLLGARDGAFMKASNIILGFINVIAITAIFICVPVGIIYLLRKPISNHYDERSGKGEASEIPQEIKHWNWGAFLLSPIWGIYHRVWIALFTSIPFFGSIWLFIFPAKTNELAWRKNRWESVEQFQRSRIKTCTK